MSSSKPRLKENIYEEDNVDLHNDIAEDLSSDTFQKPWSPFWLRYSVLASLGAVFAAMLAGLISLYNYGLHNNGIDIQLSSNHYLWTFGPTLLFVILVSLWKHVEFYCKILSPWAHLSRTPLSDGLMLDYITPLLPHTLWRSVSQRDWPVFFASLGSILLKMIIIFSTGLLLLSPTTIVEENASIQKTSKFQRGDIEDAIPELEALQYVQYANDGVAFPYGVTPEVAYDTIDSQALPTSSILDTVVDGFWPLMRCGEGKVDWKPVNASDEVLQSTFEFNITINGCPVSFNHLYPEACPPGAYQPVGLNQPDGSCYPRSLQMYGGFPGKSGSLNGAWGLLSFGPENEAAAEASTEAELNNAPCENLFIAVLAEYRNTLVPYYNNTTEPLDSSTTTIWQTKLENFAHTVCRPTYTIDDVQIRLKPTNLSEPVVQIMNSAPSHSVKHLKDFGTYNMTSLMARAVEVGQTRMNTTLYGDTAYELAGDGVTMLVYESFGSFLRLVNNNNDLNLFLDPTSLKSSTESILNSLATLMATDNLRLVHQSSALGKITYQGYRLQVQKLSVIAMCGAFGILILLTLGVALSKNRIIPPYNPNSILQQSAIAKTRLDIARMLDKCGHYSDERLKWFVAAGRYDVSRASLNDLKQAASQTQLRNEPSESITSWWTPFAVTKWGILLATAVPLLIIGTLEALQYQSDRLSGLMDIDDKSPYVNAGLLIPALLMVAVSSIYNSLFSTIVVLTPYVLLAGGHRQSGRAVSRNLVGRSLVTTAFVAMKKFSLVVLLACIGTGIGRVLNIAVSGLYTIQPVEVPNVVSFTSLDYFNNTWNSPLFYSTSLQKEPASTTLSMIELANATYPPHTFNELVYPKISSPSLNSTSQNANGSTFATIQIHATRPDLNCTFVDRRDIKTSYSTSDFLVLYVHVDSELFSDCQYDGWIQFDKTVLGHNYTMEPGLRNFRRSVDYVPDSGTYYSSGFEFMAQPTKQPDYCPSLMTWFGRLSREKPETDEITMSVCTQSVTTVQTNTTFQLPYMNISSQTPPEIDESSAKVNQYVRDVILWGYGFSSPSDENGSGSTIYGCEDPNRFFGVIHNGTLGIPPEDLVGPENEERFSNATRHVYRQYMAQVFDQYQRINVSIAKDARPDTRTVTFDASVYTGPKLRLLQYTISKLVLQAMLGTMAACALAIGVFARNLSKTLPHNPSTVAGALSLLVGSQLCSPDHTTSAQGLASLPDAEIAKQVAKSYEYRLGWWEWDEKVTKPPRFRDREGTIEMVRVKRYGIDIYGEDGSGRRYCGNYSNITEQDEARGESSGANKAQTMGEATKAKCDVSRRQTVSRRGDGDLYGCESGEDAWRGA